MSTYLEMIPPDDLNIRSFIDTGDGFVVPHWHKEIEMIYVKSGTINIGVNDQPVQLNEGDIYIINGGEVHYYFPSPGSERMVLIFDPSLFQDISSLSKQRQSLKSQISKVKNVSTEWNIDVTDRIRHIMETIHTEYREKQEGYDYAVNAKMFELMTLIYRQLPKKQEGELPSSRLTHTDQEEVLEKLDDVFTYIEEHYKDAITLEDVADYIGFSHFYFTKFFKKNTGVTFITFLNSYRLSKAKWLLANKSLPISEIAYEAGFQSTKTFYRLFKSDVNMSPLQYQKQQIKLLEKIV